MHQVNNADYAPARAGGFAKFLLVQAALLSLGAAWTATRIREINATRELPPLRDVPLEVRPIYDYPVVVSDEQLSRVLTKLRPKNSGAKTKLGHIDHALRFWTAKAVFTEPGYFSGEQLRGILTDNRQYAALYGPKQPPLLIDAPHGVRVRVQEGPATSSHVDHSPAALVEVGTTPDFPVVTPTHATTFRAVLNQLLYDFSLNQTEYEWSALVMALCLPPHNTWIDTEGQEVTFDRLAHRMMREDVPRGVCFGNHRLHALAIFLRIDDDHKILSPEVRGEIIAFLIDKTRLLVEHQHPDGFWDGKWPTQAASGNFQENLSGDGTADRILATGHALEWWATAPKECHPPREVLAKAGQWLVRTIDDLTPEQTENYFTFLSHAGRALSIWRGKYPYEVKLNEPTVAKAKP